MRSILIQAAVVAAVLLGPLASNGALGLSSAYAAGSQTARVIVKYRIDSPLLRMQAQSVSAQQGARAAALGQRIGVALVAGRAISDRSHVVFAQGMSSQQLAARIAAQGDVEYAVVDERKHVVEVPTDSYYKSGPSVGTTSGGPAVGQWYLKPPGAAGDANNTAPAAINAQQAWDTTQGSESIIVAVLDTGLRFDHSDLQGGNVLLGYDMVSADDAAGGVGGTDFTSAGDGNGRDLDASDPGDWVSATDATHLNCAPSSTSSWHGTQTLGLIGATTGNGVGIASVAHGGVKVMPVRVLGKCGGYDSDIQAGMRWAVGIHVPGVPDNTLTKARVLNMSLGGTQACSQGYIDAISEANAAGAVVVVAAGNSGGNGVGSPANCPGAIGVAGLRHAGDKVGYSDLGPQISLSAPAGNCVNVPGVCLYPIMTTSNSGSTTPVADPLGSIYTDSFGDASLGTSFSAPLVSGAAALMLSRQPSLTPALVRAKMRASARTFLTVGGTNDSIPICTSGSTSQDECYCTKSTCGAGMLDVNGAVGLAAQLTGGVTASIGLLTTTPTSGQSIALSSDSTVSAGAGIFEYEWTILNAGTTGAVIMGADDAQTLTVNATAAGTFLLQLTTTDNNGNLSTGTLPVAVVVPSSTAPASTSTTPVSSGGGGALDFVWLAMLLAAVVAFAVIAQRERRLGARLSASARGGRTG